MAKRKRKNRKMERFPKLSAVDKTLYTILLWLVVLLFVACVIGFCLLRDVIGFADETVAAKEDNISKWLALIPLIVFALAAFVFLKLCMMGKWPLFGQKNFRYGQSGWTEVYPLFMKNRPKRDQTEDQKRGRKLVTMFVVGVLLISCVPLPLSLYGRDCLHYDGSITQHNMFNIQVREYASGQIAEVEYKTHQRRVKRTGIDRYEWDAVVVLTTENGRKYSFSNWEFRDAAEGNIYWLTAMLQMKARYSPQIITYSGTENLENVIWDNGLSAEEEKLLRQLFGME